jgi:hypothetical protein
MADWQRWNLLLGLVQQSAFVVTNGMTLPRGVDNGLRLGSAIVIAGQANGKVNDLANVARHDEVYWISKPKETKRRKKRRHP